MMCINLRLDDYARDHAGQAPDSIETLLKEPTEWLCYEEDSESFANQIAHIIQRMVIKPHYKFPKGSAPMNTIAVLIPKGSVDSGEYVYCTSFSGSGGYETAEDFELSADKSFLAELRYRDSHPGSFKVIKKTDERKMVKLYIVSENTTPHDQRTTRP